MEVEVSKQLSLIDALLSNFDKTIKPCANKKNEKKEEETQDAMPDSTTNTEKNNGNPFHCGDDVLVPNKDGRYYLGTIVELSTSNDNDSCEVGTGVARCLVKFGDGTHAWAPVASLKLLSAPPADDGRIMCVVCKRRGESAAGGAVVACDMCGRGYHAECHSPPVEAWIHGASWHCKRCVDQRYRVAAAENRAMKRSDLFRFKGGQQRRQQQELTPPCDTASTTSSSTASDGGKDPDETHCYCGEKSDWLAQMLLCCRCSRWFHQRCVSSLQYPLYAGDKLYIFACANCNGGEEYLRRLELCWLDLAHLALYNLTAYNAPNYFDLDNVIMPYIMDNWHALQLPEKMWRTPAKERREKILTALTSSRKRFKCGREMKKRATIWGLRLRRPPPPPLQLSALEQIKKGEPLTDELVREYAPRLRLLSRAPAPHTVDDSSQPSSSNNEKSSYKKQRMIVPVDGHWLNLMMGKRFHENLNSNSNSENDSTSSYESAKTSERDEQPSPSVCTSSARKSDAKDDRLEKMSERNVTESNEAKSSCEKTSVPSHSVPLLPCSVKLDKIPKDNIEDVNLNPFVGPMIRPMKRKLSEKDIVIGPNGEVKRRKYRRPRKYLQMQLNKSCPLPDEPTKAAAAQNENGNVTAPVAHNMSNVKFHGRRLRQRQEKNYYENARRNTNSNANNNNSVKSLQLSPHKANSVAAEADAKQLSALKSSVQSYFRAGQTFHILARRHAANAPPAYLIEWDSNAP
ncbi:unnamed protein product, partial [Iphiclides podalirius]